jgi:hypothetical protein
MLILFTELWGFMRGRNKNCVLTNQPDLGPAVEEGFEFVSIEAHLHCDGKRIRLEQKTAIFHKPWVSAFNQHANNTI